MSFTQPVTFRKFPGHNDVIALFPTQFEPSPSRLVGPLIMSYQSIGQHSPASASLHDDLLPATETEYIELLTELKQVGYDNLIVTKHFLLEEDINELNSRLADYICLHGELPAEFNYDDTRDDAVLNKDELMAYADDELLLLLTPTAEKALSASV